MLLLQFTGILAVTVFVTTVETAAVPTNNAALENCKYEYV